MVGFNLDFSYSRFCGFYVLARGYFIFFILSYIFTNKQLPDGAPDECCRVSSTELKAFIYKVCKEKNGNSPNGSDSYRLVRVVGNSPVKGNVLIFHLELLSRQRGCRPTLVD